MRHIRNILSVRQREGFGTAADDFATHKYPERFFNVVYPEFFPIFFKQGQLLIKAQQPGGKQQPVLYLAVIVLCVDIENSEILAVTVGIKMAIGIIKNNGSTVFPE